MTRTRLMIAAATLAAIGITGCGDDDDFGGGATPSAGELDGRTFVATTLTGGSIVDGSEIVLSFADDAIVVAAGCNTQRGGYSVADGKLVVDVLASTMMACDDALMTQDQFVAQLVSSSPEIALDGDQLTIESETTAMTLQER